LVGVELSVEFLLPKRRKEKTRDVLGDPITFKRSGILTLLVEESSRHLGIFRKAGTDQFGPRHSDLLEGGSKTTIVEKSNLNGGCQVEVLFKEAKRSRLDFFIGNGGRRK
jgi:hypothetical protein